MKTQNTQTGAEKGFPRIARDRKYGGYFVKYSKRERSILTHAYKVGAVAELNNEDIGGITK